MPSRKSAGNGTDGRAPVPPSITTMADVIVVLGMHRSGTSGVAGTLTKLGASLPKNLLPANDFNERGPGAFKKRAYELYQSEFNGSPFPVVKDPRICRFAPFWLDLLKGHQHIPRVVMPIRSPLDVAYSLKKRDGFPLTKGFQLWLRASTRQEARSIVLWHDFSVDWRGICAKIARAYKTGLEHVWTTQQDNFDEIIMFNHTFYGPLNPVSELSEAIASTACDFWGVTAHSEEVEKASNGERRVPFHLNSHFTLRLAAELF